MRLLLGAALLAWAGPASAQLALQSGAALAAGLTEAARLVREFQERDGLAGAAMDGLPAVVASFPREALPTLRYNLGGLTRSALRFPGGRASVSGLVPLERDSPEELIKRTPSMAAVVLVVTPAEQAARPNAYPGVPRLAEGSFYYEVRLRAGRGEEGVFRAVVTGTGAARRVEALTPQPPS